MDLYFSCIFLLTLILNWGDGEVRQLEGPRDQISPLRQKLLYTERLKIKAMLDTNIILTKCIFLAILCVILVIVNNKNNTLLGKNN